MTEQSHLTRALLLLELWQESIRMTKNAIDRAANPDIVFHHEYIVDAIVYRYKAEAIMKMYNRTMQKLLAA